MFWLFSFILVFVLNTLNSKTFREDAINEQNLIGEFLGENSKTKINESSSEIYKVCCNFLAKYTAYIFVPDENRDVEKVFKKGISDFHGSFWTSVYMSIVRSHIALLWLYVLSFVFVGLFMQARTKRKILTHTIGYSSPDKYKWGWHSLLATFGGFFTYIFFPIAIHPLSPLILLFVAMMGLYLIVSNFQQRI